MRLKGRRPSGALVVATAALIFAVAGSAVAASQLVSGDKLIKKRSLSGNRLRNHTIGRTQINLGALGKVPGAVRADTAAAATNASNANALANQPPANYLTVANRIGTKGVMTDSASQPQPVTLFTTGPFTVMMSCTKSGSNVSLTVTAKSSEANSVAFGNLLATPNSAVDIGPDVGPASAFRENMTQAVDFEAPSGANALLVAEDGINSLNTDCWANWAGIH